MYCDMVVVSRHAGAIDWLAAHLFPRDGPARRDHAALVWDRYDVDYDSRSPKMYVVPRRSVPLIVEAQAEDVRGKVVVGNLPLHLACLAAEVWAIEFAGDPPRGAEYSRVEMEAAGARLSKYRVDGVGHADA